MDKINFRMIGLARDARGLSQKGLSDLLPKLNQPNLSKIERGELPISEEAILNISKALGFPVEFFLQEEVKSPLSNIYFRKRATIQAKEMNKIFADVKIILRSIDLLLEEIDFVEYPKYVFDISEGWTPYAVAERMRELMSIPLGVPVTDLISRIEKMGVIVYFYNSATLKFDGLTCYTDNGTPVIFVNKNFTNDRIKFTVTHELFHLLMHLPCNVEPWRNPEAEADEATSEFLMPAKGCQKDLNKLTYFKLGELKSYWGVSKAAIVRRAKDLNMIDASTYTYLMIELGRRGERKLEQGYVSLDKPKILPTVLNLLKTELEYTDEQLSKRVSLNTNDYLGYFDTNPGPVNLRIVKNSA